ncbi:MAG: hypothetical protein JSV52_04515 [Candidatus Zixiibacteriota bacterium]|nr:MAG: hypothetical protein JSV52_04515 [candidate division Zixibacteria bacterium]
MVLMLIVLGAWMYHLFLYYTWNVSAVAAFISGALFGFCPYHVVKAHAHINLIGACFWGGALAVLVYSYVKNRFRWPYAVLFAVLLWSTFWTSFVEFFMLAVVLVCVVAVMEIGAFSSRTSGLPRRIMFYLPAMVGAVPAALFLSRAPSDIVDVKLYQQLAFVDLMTFPKLSVLSGLAVSSFPEFWGVYVPVSTIMLAIPGVVAMRINGRKGLKAILILAGICLAAVLDPFHAVSGILRSLPMGTGFRVFSRFFPFFLFFFLILACHGLNHIIQKWKLWARVSVALAFLAITITEYYPQGLNVSPVKNFSLNARQTNQLKRDRFVLVIPEGRYRNVHDTYQVTMNMRFVYLSYLARTDTRIAAKRRQRFPMVYAGKPIGNQEEFLRELKKLGVGYVLFENAAQAANFPLQGDVVHESNNELLMSICDQL